MMAAERRRRSAGSEVFMKTPKMIMTEDRFVDEGESYQDWVRHSRCGCKT
jgi:hypothetical protein